MPDTDPAPDTDTGQMEPGPGPAERAAALHVPAPLRTPDVPVGRTSTTLDGDGGPLPVEVWYPAEGPGRARSHYELFPGVGFATDATEAAPPRPGPHPVVVWSHGRTGTRTSYVVLCEALAAHGSVVVAPDHRGDTLSDWLGGTAVDDPTNEARRVADLGRVLAWVTDHGPGTGATTAGDPLPALDAERVVLAGHSYGGWAALATAASDHGGAVRGVAALQPFSRTLSPAVLARVAAPVLVVAGAADTTTPPAHDAHPAFEAVGAGADLVEVAEAGHQACSDVGLYLELLPRAEGLPEVVGQLVGTMAADVTGRAGDPWRPLLQLQVDLLAAWVGAVLGQGALASTVASTVAGRSGVVHRSRRA